MSRESASDMCRALPGAELTHPFGDTPEDHDVWKVGGKIFAAMSVDADGVSVKCADVATAEMLREAGVAQKAPYFHKSWVRVPFGAGEDELRHRIETSYGIIRGSLTKKAQAALPDWTQG
ncbi:MmcQ/YjbR family DNA-binding protein [Aliiroseovarius crassostreae]|uniref:MmcQ/YjbR family DNA-binding protein n=1 Tax=Aliiroseovarius crassostreae TaxID=154981 RepID=UPI003C7AD1E3